MDTISRLLDLAKKRAGIPTDMALAERLGVSRQLLSNWRNGNHPISDDRVSQIAHLAGEDAGMWMAAINAAQSQGTAAKDWLEVAKRLGYAACLVLAMGWAGTTHAASKGHSEVRIMYKRLRFMLQRGNWPALEGA